MADIIIKDSSGAPHTYTGVESVSYPDVLGGIAKFVQGREFTHNSGSLSTSKMTNGRFEVDHGLGTMPDLVIITPGYNNTGEPLAITFGVGFRSAIAKLQLGGTWAGTFETQIGIDENGSSDTDICCTDQKIIVKKLPEDDVSKVSSYRWDAFAGLYNG